jgi:hypothetical protein
MIIHQPRPFFPFSFPFSFSCQFPGVFLIYLSLAPAHRSRAICAVSRRNPTRREPKHSLQSSTGQIHTTAAHSTSNPQFPDHDQRSRADICLFVLQHNHQPTPTSSHRPASRSVVPSDFVSSNCHTSPTRQIRPKAAIRAYPHLAIPATYQLARRSESSTRDEANASITCEQLMLGISEKGYFPFKVSVSVLSGRVSACRSTASYLSSFGGKSRREMRKRILQSKG